MVKGFLKGVGRGNDWANQLCQQVTGAGYLIPQLQEGKLSKSGAVTTGIRAVCSQ